jgi:benzoylformate decarboxylase
MTAPSTTVRDAVLQLLRSFGMQRIFGNPGSTELPLFLDFPADFEYVLGLQESVVVGMADGYATATDNAAFVNLHSAVGVGHAMGAIFTAWKNRTPLVITAGQQARSLFPFDPFLFSAQATELPKPLRQVELRAGPGRRRAPGDRPRLLPRHAAAARTGAGLDPVRRLGPRLCTVEPRRVSLRRAATRPSLAAIGAALDASERPAFVVGAGVDRGGAWDEVRALAERHRARVFTAPMSARCGFAEDHPQFAGFLPAMRERIVAALAEATWCWCSVRPRSPTTSKARAAPAGRRPLCQITDDADTAARAPVGTAAVGDLRDAVQTLLQAAGAARAAGADGSAGAAAR